MAAWIEEHAFPAGLHHRSTQKFGTQPVLKLVCSKQVSVPSPVTVAPVVGSQAEHGQHSQWLGGRGAGRA